MQMHGTAQLSHRMPCDARWTHTSITAQAAAQHRVTEFRVSTLQAICHGIQRKGELTVCAAMMTNHSSCVMVTLSCRRLMAISTTDKLIILELLHHPATAAVIPASWNA